jgi:hypothetical protein
VTKVLLKHPSVDTAVALVLLAEAIASLTAKGVPETKLLSKLRRDPEIWPTWAELRAASLLARLIASNGQLRFEPGGTSSAQPDFLITTEDRSSGIEFKAIGLSYEELQFCERMSPALDTLLPSRGFVTLHAKLDVERIRVETLPKSELDDDAARVADAFPNFPAGLAGVVIAAHGGERKYRRRLLKRVYDEVCRQLARTNGGWAALYWTNGSDIQTLTESIRWDELPRHLEGLIIVGDAVAFPQPTIHSFCFILPRVNQKTGDELILSSVDPDFAEKVMQRYERSSGVRMILLADRRDRGNAEGVELLRRDHSRGILPFNFLLDVDPRNVTGRQV